METLKNGNFKGQNYDKILSLAESKKNNEMI